MASNKRKQSNTDENLDYSSVLTNGSETDRKSNESCKYEAIIPCQYSQLMLLFVVGTMMPVSSENLPNTTDEMKNMLRMQRMFICSVKSLYSWNHR
jgi:hypothetical protein